MGVSQLPLSTAYANPPACRVYRTTSMTGIVDSAQTAVTFDAERFDTNSMHDTSTNTSRITFNTAGVYVVTFNMAWGPRTDYLKVQCSMRLNGTTFLCAHTDTDPGTQNIDREMSVTTVCKFAAADYVEAMVFQDNTANATGTVVGTGNYGAEFAAAWLGLGT
jgi:hypothetical protein